MLPQYTLKVTAQPRRLILTNLVFSPAEHLSWELKTHKTSPEVRVHRKLSRAGCPHSWSPFDTPSPPSAPPSRIKRVSFILVYCFSGAAKVHCSLLVKIKDCLDQGCNSNGALFICTKRRGFLLGRWRFQSHFLEVKRPPLRYEHFLILPFFFF